MMMPPRRSALLLLLAAFLTGGGIGLLVGRQLGDADHRPRRSAGAGGYLTRLTRQLDLSAEQRDSVRAVLDRYQPGFDSVWAESRPRYETLRTRVRSDIRAQLTPEQQLRYDSMIARRDSARRLRER
jgi:hypothetical protein